MVSASLGAGGAERSLVVLAKQLKEMNHEVVVVTLDSMVEDAFPLDETIERIQMAPSYPSGALWKMPFFLMKLRKLLLNLNADHYLSFVIETNIITLLALKGYEQKIHIWNQSDYFQEPHPAWVFFLARALFKKAKTVAFLDQSQADSWSEKFSKSAIGIPNPVDEIKSEGREYELPGKYNIIGMGRLYDVKGFDKLIRMFSELESDFPDWGLVILGDGELRLELQSMIDSLDLGSRIKMLGNIFPPFDVLKQCDIFAFTSRFEGQGMALIEAMACGLTAVSFDCPSGPRNIIDNDVNGILVSDQNEAIFKQKLFECMSSEDLRKKLSSNAMNVSEKFSRKTIAETWLKCFN